MSESRVDQWNAKKMILAVAMAAAVAVCMADTKATYRDAQGRVQGSTK